MAKPLDVDKAPEVTNILTANETAKPAVNYDTEQYTANYRTAIRAQHGPLRTSANNLSQIRPLASSSQWLAIAISRKRKRQG